MIAKNFRQFPEALLFQLELPLGDVRETLEWMRVNSRTVWTIWARRLTGAPADKRGMIKIPAWFAAMRRRAQALSQAVKAAIQSLFCTGVN